MDFLTLAKTRYSCRKLTDRPVSEEQIRAILQAGLAAPTACNNQPFKIWVMTSEDALAKVKSVCKQPFIQPCPVVFVIGGDPKTAWVRDYDGKNFADVDASIVETHLLLEIADLGLATTWIGHFDPEKLCELFPDMNGYSLTALFAVGYAAEDASPAMAHTRCRSEYELIKRY